LDLFGDLIIEHERRCKSVAGVGTKLKIGGNAGKFSAGGEKCRKRGGERKRKIREGEGRSKRGTEKECWR